MRLFNARLWNEPDRYDIHISGDAITSVRPSAAERGRFNALLEADLEGSVVVPGFINSHEHLDFNCYPSLAHGTYPDYLVWGRDIHERFAEQISEVRKIPPELRIRWGLYKNLLNGFTTVVNHGVRLSIPAFPVSVVQENHILHSPGFEKHWKWKLNDPFRRGKPCVIHAGEGTSDAAAAEIRSLIRANWFGKKIIMVHGVAMHSADAVHFTGLVWCPASNYFLLGETADVRSIGKKIPVVFGTDSTLSSSWDVAQHFRMARLSGAADNEMLLRMLTKIPAELWRLQEKGKIAAGKKADLLVLDPDTDIFKTGAAGIRMLMQDGSIRMIDDAMIPVVKGFSTEGLSRIRLQDRVKWVTGDLPALAREIRTIYPALQVPFVF